MKQVSFKTSIETKELVKKARHKAEAKSYKGFVHDTILEYITSKKYKNLNVRRSEIKECDANPTSLDFTLQEYEKIQRVLDETNRHFNVFVNMILVHLTRNI